MAHIARSMKNIEPPRPLKAQRALLKNNFMVVEELIQLIENVALSLQSGVNDVEPMASLVQNLRSLGPQLERVSKDTLDRAFVVFRNASQDERLNIMTRLNLLELIELRAKGWEVTGFNSYYDTIRTTKATNIEVKAKQTDKHRKTSHVSHLQNPLNPFNPQQHHHIADVNDATFLDTSPPLGAASAASVAADASAHRLLLGPGELIRNSGKFPKPTKIPGKTYCKDEVVIRNADSGKAMGMKGRRVHMIEGLSETIISFQRVNPGAKERLVQITGPSEEKINYAKQLIEDTIRRNASPVRLDPAMAGHTGGSCSSLASSNSDDAATPRAVIGVGAGNLSNRLSLNTVQNFMTASAAAQQVAAVQQQATVAALLAKSASNAAAAAVAGEYKYTVNVGQHVIKITGDCCDLVRVAKLVLDDYFCSADFLVSAEARDALENTHASPLSAPSTPMAQQQFAGGFPLADSGVGLNYMAGQIASNIKDADDDDVFADTNGASSQNNNVLTRSRRSHFSRKDSTPEAVTSNAAQNKLEKDPITGKAIIMSSPRIVHNYDSLLQYAHSPRSWALPKDWPKICEKFPSLVRNKDIRDESHRFDGKKYLELVKSASKRNIATADESINDTENHENE